MHTRIETQGAIQIPTLFLGKPMPLKHKFSRNCAGGIVVAARLLTNSYQSENRGTKVEKMQ